MTEQIAKNISRIVKKVGGSYVIPLDGEIRQELGIIDGSTVYISMVDTDGTGVKELKLKIQKLEASVSSLNECGHFSPEEADDVLEHVHGRRPNTASA